MYESKIEKFTDRILQKQKRQKNNSKKAVKGGESYKLNSEAPINIVSNCIMNEGRDGNRKTTHSPFGAAIISRQRDENQSSGQVHSSRQEKQHFRSEKYRLGLSKTDIDKLQLMCADLTAQQYLQKLIQIHEEQKAVKNQEQLIILNYNHYGRGQKVNQDQLSSQSEQQMDNEKEKNSSKDNKFLNILDLQSDIGSDAQTSVIDILRPSQSNISRTNSNLQIVNKQINEFQSPDVPKQEKNVFPIINFKTQAFKGMQSIKSKQNKQQVVSNQYNKPHNNNKQKIINKNDKSEGMIAGQKNTNKLSPYLDNQGVVIRKGGKHKLEKQFYFVKSPKINKNNGKEAGKTLCGKQGAETTSNENYLKNAAKMVEISTNSIETNTNNLNNHQIVYDICLKQPKTNTDINSNIISHIDSYVISNVSSNIQIEDTSSFKKDQHINLFKYTDSNYASNNSLTSHQNLLSADKKPKNTQEQKHTQKQRVSMKKQKVSFETSNLQSNNFIMVKKTANNPYNQLKSDNIKQSCHKNYEKQSKSRHKQKKSQYGHKLGINDKSIGLKTQNINNQKVKPDNKKQTNRNQGKVQIIQKTKLKQKTQEQSQQHQIFGQIYEYQAQVPHAKNLEEICYAEIGKRLVITSQKQIHRQFFKTNLHIRAYLMRNIVQYIKYIAQFSPNSIFILPNERALHFQPNQKPQQLNPYLQHTNYVQIIRNVNHIIQKNIFKQKYQQELKDYWPYIIGSLFLIIVVMILAVLFLGDYSLYQNDQASHKFIGLVNIFMVVIGLVICLFMVIVIGYSLQCYNNKTVFRPVCETIYEDIDSYFKYINGKMENNLEWIIGQSFFWVQVKIHENTDRNNWRKNSRFRRNKFKNYPYNDHLEEEIIPSLRQ